MVDLDVCVRSVASNANESSRPLEFFPETLVVRVRSSGVGTCPRVRALEPDDKHAIPTAEVASSTVCNLPGAPSMASVDTVVGGLPL